MRQFFPNHLPDHLKSRLPVHVFKQRVIDQGLIVSSARVIHYVAEVLKDAVIQAN
jgi:hypothetical protein